MARVSILLTCYNHLSYLPAALDSIRAQTCKGYEVLAIDDGSTDGTREWLAEQPDVRTLFTETNLGTYGALNAGLAATDGEFVAILNDDDLWAPEKLERQLALMDAHPEVGLVHTDGHFIDGQGAKVEGKPLGFSFPRFETGDLLLNLYFENKIIASAALARRACFDQLGGFNDEYFGSGDWEMWFRIAEAYQVGFVPEPLTFYRVHGAQASQKLERIWRDDEKLRLWIASREDQHRNRPAEALTQAVAHNLACLGTVKMLNGQPREARQFYGQSIRRRPGRWQTYARWLMTFGGAQRFKDSVLAKNTRGL